MTDERGESRTPSDILGLWVLPDPQPLTIDASTQFMEHLVHKAGADAA